MGFHIKDIIDLIRQHKDEIIKDWLSDERVVEILARNSITKEFFEQKYALSLLEYFELVALGKVEGNSCPAMLGFIHYLAEHDAKSEDIFMLCANAKRSVTNLILSHSKKDALLVEDIQKIFDNNLFNILKIFSQKLIEKDRLLVAQSKKAIVGEMMEFVTHQWKEPISVLKFAISKLEYKFNTYSLSKEDFTKEAGFIKKALVHMSSIVDSFRDFFSTQRSLQSTSIADVVNEINDLVAPLFKSNSIDVRFEIDEDIKILTYKNDLIQALLNLFANAKDALVESGVSQKVVKIIATKSTDDAVIEIVDNGGGIKTKVISDIFLPNFSTKKDGNGIGLYMTKSLIENNLGGKLKVKNTTNEFGDGASFEVILPIKIS